METTPYEKRTLLRFSGHCWRSTNELANDLLQYGRNSVGRLGMLSLRLINRNDG